MSGDDEWDFFLMFFFGFRNVMGTSRGSNWNRIQRCEMDADLEVLQSSKLNVM